MIGFQDLISAIKYRRRLAGAIAAAIFLGLFAIALLLPRQYTATSSVLVDLTDTDPASDKTQQDTPQIVDTVVGTQVDILRSGAVMTAAVRAAGIVDKQPGDDENGKTQKAITVVQKALGVTTDKGSNVIRLYYVDKDPQEAARILNIIVKTFLAKQVLLRTAPAENSAQWYNSRTREVRDRYEKAQKHLADFQRQNGIVGVDRMDVEGDKVRTLSGELVKAQADAALANSRSGSINDPEVAKADSVQNLVREAGVQQGKVGELSKRLGPNHPELIAAQAELAQLRDAIASARSVQAGALTSASGAAQKREAELKTRLAEQQQKMIMMSGVQDQLMVLQRDVDAARQTYDTVRQRFNESALRSEVSQANTSLLDAAQVPAIPSSPNLILWFVAAVLAAALGSIGAIAWQEIMHPRVRTAEGTSTLIDTEVLMDMTLPARASSARQGQGEFA